MEFKASLYPVLADTAKRGDVVTLSNNTKICLFNLVRSKIIKGIRFDYWTWERVVTPIMYKKKH